MSFATSNHCYWISVCSFNRLHPSYKIHKMLAQNVHWIVWTCWDIRYMYEWVSLVNASIEIAFAMRCVECLHPQNLQSTQYFTSSIASSWNRKISHPADLSLWKCLYKNACAKFNDKWHCTNIWIDIRNDVRILKIIPNKTDETLQMAFIGNIENILSKKRPAASCFTCKSFGAFFLHPSIHNYIRIYSHTWKSCARKTRFECKKSRIHLKFINLLVANWPILVVWAIFLLLSTFFTAHILFLRSFFGLYFPSSSNLETAFRKILYQKRERKRIFPSVISRSCQEWSDEMGNRDCRSFCGFDMSQEPKSFHLAGFIFCDIRHR